MRKIPAVLLLAFIILLAAPGVISAQAATPVGACPSGYDPMDYHSMPGDMDGMLHAGITVDLNGDGIICMKEVSISPVQVIHVHVDNFVMAP